MTVDIMELVNTIEAKMLVIKDEPASDRNNGMLDGLMYVLQFCNKAINEYDQGMADHFHKEGAK